jgi:hypothetical protein
MLVTFFDNQGIIHTEFAPPSQVVNMEYYVQVGLVWPNSSSKTSVSEKRKLAPHCTITRDLTLQYH